MPFCNYLFFSSVKSTRCTLVHNNNNNNNNFCAQQKKKKKEFLISPGLFVSYFLHRNRELHYLVQEQKFMLSIKAGVSFFVSSSTGEREK